MLRNVEANAVLFYVHTVHTLVRLGGVSAVIKLRLRRCDVLMLNATGIGLCGLLGMLVQIWVLLSHSQFSDLQLNNTMYWYFTVLPQDPTTPPPTLLSLVIKLDNFDKPHFLAATRSNHKLTIDHSHVLPVIWAAFELRITAWLK